MPQEIFAAIKTDMALMREKIDHLCENVFKDDVPIEVNILANYLNAVEELAYRQANLQAVKKTSVEYCY